MGIEREDWREELKVENADANGGGGIKTRSSDESDECRCNTEEANKRKRKKNGKAKLVSDNGKPVKKKNTRYGKAKPPRDATKVLVSTIAEEEGGSRPRLLLSKTVTDSDIKGDHNRLLISERDGGIKRALEEELTKDEMQQMLDQTKHGGLRVNMVDGERRKYRNEMGRDVTGKHVFMYTTFRYLNSNRAFRVIGNNYKLLVANNNMRVKLDAIHIYLFHVDREGGEREVWLAMMKEPVQPEEGPIVNVEEHAAEPAMAAPLLAEENETVDEVETAVAAALVAMVNEAEDGVKPAASPLLMTPENKWEEELASAEYRAACVLFGWVRQDQRWLSRRSTTVHRINHSSSSI